MVMFFVVMFFCGGVFVVVFFVAGGVFCGGG